MRYKFGEREILCENRDEVEKIYKLVENEGYKWGCDRHGKKISVNTISQSGFPVKISCSRYGNVQYTRKNMGYYDATAASVLKPNEGMGIISADKMTVDEFLRRIIKMRSICRKSISCKYCKFNDKYHTCDNNFQQLCDYLPINALNVPEDRISDFITEIKEIVASGNMFVETQTEEAYDWFSAQKKDSEIQLQYYDVILSALGEKVAKEKSLRGKDVE